MTSKGNKSEDNIVSYEFFFGFMLFWLHEEEARMRLHRIHVYSNLSSISF